MSSPTGAQGAPQASPGGFLPSSFADWLRDVHLLPWVGASIAVIAVIVLFGHKMRMRRRELRRAILGLPNGARFRVVDGMIHCVWHTRHIDPKRLKRALEIARNTTNMDYTTDHLREAAMRADRLIIPTNFRYMADGLTSSEKMLVFSSALSVLLADGPLSAHDRNILKILARGLRLRRDELRSLGNLIPN
ncbi:MAG: hypothetical protein WBA67_11090 [Jannaschia sp.]